MRAGDRQHPGARAPQAPSRLLRGRAKLQLISRPLRCFPPKVTQRSSLAAFPRTTREIFVSGKALRYSKAAANEESLFARVCKAKAGKPRVWQAVTLLLPGRGGTPLPAPTPAGGTRRAARRGAWGCPARQGPRRCRPLSPPAMPPAVPPSRHPRSPRHPRCPPPRPSSGAPARRPARRAPPAQLPAGQVRGRRCHRGGDPGGGHARPAERKGRRRRAVRHLPRPLGGRRGGGAAPGGGLGGAVGCGARPSPALPTLSRG